MTALILPFPQSAWVRTPAMVSEMQIAADSTLSEADEVAKLHFGMGQLKQDAQEIREMLEACDV